MCDEFTLADDAARKGVSRREFTVLGGAVALAGCAGMTRSPPAGLGERMVSVATPDGTADAFFVHPAKGKHPGVLLWPDIAGLREAYKIMARRLAGAGYAVLAVNHYYRTSAAPVVSSMAEWRTPEGQAKLGPMIAAITPAATTSDARAFVAFLDAQGAVDQRRKIGTNGYCMGGPYTVRTAAAVPARVGAAASFHGGGLVTAEPDSPHRLLAATSASYLFAIAQNDDARAPTDKDTLRAATQAAGRPAEIEVYAADHGWCTIDAPVYNQAEADRAWARMLALYATL
ncbi:MAG TPA: dienelactone hydrolase family protein [Novosphingobium sp.]|nr:dienelactone hydrolase family protein [Novosphingobium sp.]